MGGDGGAGEAAGLTIGKVGYVFFSFLSWDYSF